ncbi:DUF3105 domain-containing protein [Streptomyces sp. V4-01]|uniref:DUF3105 domain-containing protein n=1 Tax=Actinacidiphila polyblastidii TaxID=3110430 RepID=A0ABU7PH34_9ACTN|nr:DUF3105 domain-containing protein [Streptomyces sp. V4-01]
MTSGKAAKAARTQAAEDRRRKIAEQRAVEQRRQRRRSIYIWGGVGAAVIALGGGVTALLVSQKSSGSIAGVVSYGNLARNHVTTKVKYPQTPPVGGNHNPVWLNCGVYDKPVANENAVHDMEHGAVWITYKPDLPAAQVASLKKTVGSQTYLDLSPYPGLPAPVVASAWGKQLKLQSATDPRLAEFIAKYKQGPQTPEPGAPCTGGTGTPTG